MKIVSENPISEFHFWSGAAELAKHLSEKEMDQIENILEEQYPDGMTDTELNDFFWYEGQTIAEWLGYEKEDDLLLRDDPQHWLNRATDIIKEIRDELVPEFDENDLKEYFEKTGMDMDQFLNENGYKDYIAEISEETVEFCEENDYFSDYEETIKYLNLGVIIKDIEDRTRDISDAELSILISRAVDVIDREKGTLSYDREEAADKIQEELEAFDLEPDKER